jgi:hypothetical protein
MTIDCSQAEIGDCYTDANQEVGEFRGMDVNKLFSEDRPYFFIKLSESELYCFSKEGLNGRSRLVCLAGSSTRPVESLIVSVQRSNRAIIMRRAMRRAVNPEPTSENERYLTLFISNGGGW